jgi:hypothetical protein
MADTSRVHVQCVGWQLAACQAVHAADGEQPLGWAGRRELLRRGARDAVWDRAQCSKPQIPPQQLPAWCTKGQRQHPSQKGGIQPARHSKQARWWRLCAPGEGGGGGDARAPTPRRAHQVQTREAMSCGTQIRAAKCCFFAWPPVQAACDCRVAAGRLRIVQAHCWGRTKCSPTSTCRWWAAPTLTA